MPGWLVLIHQLPQKPDYLRVKVRRRLQRLGALALKNSVYVLPRREDTQEDFEWLVVEVEAEGGEVLLCAADFLHGASDTELEARFRAERDADYAELAAAAADAARNARTGLRPDRLPVSALEVARLRRRLDDIARIDFFGAAGRTDAEGKIERLELERARARSLAASAQSDQPVENASGSERPRGATWVTRAGIFVDRIASAWLIRRFIDPAATFKFVPRMRYRPEPGELRFDMAGGEYSHEGDRCTFEVLLDRFGLDDSALWSIAELVHDIDLKDERYDRPELPGLLAVLDGIAQPERDDADRLTLGAAVFDGLHARFGAPRA